MTVWYERAHLSSNWLQVRLQLGLFQVCICFSRWNPSEEVPTTSENFLLYKITGLLFKAIRLNCREWGAGETHYTSTRLHRLGGGDVKEENSLSCHSHRIQIWVHSTRYYDGLCGTRDRRRNFYINEIIYNIVDGIFNLILTDLLFHVHLSNVYFHSNIVM